MFVEVGDEVGADTLLVTEHRQYRHVEATRPDGSVRTARGEILGLDGTKWIQRGKESTLRGKIAEDAANQEIADTMAQKKADGAISDYIQVDPSNGSGGFDGARVNLMANWLALGRSLKTQPMSPFQQRAVDRAIKARALKVEIRLTRATRVGTQGEDAALTQLRTRIDGDFGPGTLQDVQNVGDSYLEGATLAATEVAP